MASKELFDLPEYESTDLDGAFGFYLVDPVNGSRFVTLGELKTFINTDPTVVPSSVPWRGARVKRSSNITGITFPYVVSWNDEVEDTDGFWSLGAPTRFTIPSGIARVRLRANVHFEASATAGTLLVGLLKNGSTLQGSTQVSSRDGTTGFSDNKKSVFSWTESVTAGDYFEVRTNRSGMSTVDEVISSEYTWFEIEVVEASI